MIRRYHISDTRHLIDLLDQNTPDFFAPLEKAAYVSYLQNKIDDYFVYEINDTIVGCGGINYEIENKTARISWDIIHPEYQRKGIGKKLVDHRIQHIKNKKYIDIIIVRTSQMAFPFYKKLGFKLESVKEDFWAKGFDLYLMSKKNR